MNPAGADTPLCRRYVATITSLVLLLLTSSLAQVNFAYAQSQTPTGQFPQNIIVSSNTDTTPNSLELLATQEEGAAVQEVSGFSLDTTDNITAQPSSQLLVFVSDSSVEVIGAKASSASDQFIDLTHSTSQQSTNAFSLANLPVGVYTLDILTQKENTKAAYEGILEIGQQPATSAAPSPSPQPATSPVALPPPSNEDGGDDDGGGDDDSDTGNQGEDNGNGDDNDGSSDDSGDDGGGGDGDGDSGGNGDANDEAPSGPPNDGDSED